MSPSFFKKRNACLEEARTFTSASFPFFFDDHFSSPGFFQKDVEGNFFWRKKGSGRILSGTIDHHFLLDEVQFQTYSQEFMLITTAAPGLPPPWGTYFTTAAEEKKIAPKTQSGVWDGGIQIWEKLVKGVGGCIFFSDIC